MQGISTAAYLCGRWLGELQAEASSLDGPSRGALAGRSASGATVPNLDPENFQTPEVAEQRRNSVYPLRLSVVVDQEKAAGKW